MLSIRIIFKPQIIFAGFLLHLLVLSSFLSAQVANFIAPDTVCVGESIALTNTSTGGFIYYWNFCSGNANESPTGVNIGNPGNLLNIPTYITLVKFGTNCWSFVSCQGVGVVRYFHGNSFKNNPLLCENLGTFGGSITYNQEGIQVKEDNGQWYGFVCSDTKLVRLNFAGSPGNTPTATSLPFSGLNMLHGLVIIKEGTTWLGFATCSTGNKMVRFNFGNSLANTPVMTDFGNFAGFTSPAALCIVQENSLWYGLVMAGNNTISRIIFGSSLLNTPTGSNLGNPGGLNSAGGLTLLCDCESTTGYYVNYLSPGQLGKLTFPTGITGAITGQVLGNIGDLDKPHSFSELFRQNDTLFAYVTNRQNGTLTRLTFPPCNNASVPSSSLYNPPVFSYNTPGTYNVRLILNEGNPDQSSMCKSIVVLAAPCNTVASFSAPDTVCTGSPVSLTNTSTGGSSYYWNFCSGNAASTPTGLNIGNPSAGLNWPVYSAMVKDGDDCYQFITNQGTPTHLTRLYHGTNFRNNPITVTTMLQTGILHQYVEALQIRNDNGNWIGLVCNNNTILRLNFGSSILNTSPVVTDLGPFTGIAVAHGITIVKEGTTWLAFFDSHTTNKLFRLNFGNSLTNAPVFTDLGNIAGFSHPTQIASVKENGMCYLLINNYNSNTLSRISFGSSFLNTPSGQNLGNCGGLDKPHGICLLNDCETSVGYYTTYRQSPLGAIGRLSFSGGLGGTVTAQSLGNLGGLDNPCSFSDLFRQNDSLFTYVMNQAGSTLTRFSFPPCSNASIPSSTQVTPPSFFYNTPGTYSVRLVVNEGQFTESSVCHSIIAIPQPVVNLGNDRSICPGTTTTLDAGSGFSSYLWSTGATTQTITVNSAGIYWAKVTNYGCLDYDTVAVSLYPFIPVNLGPDQTICTGQTTTFNAGSCTGCSYVWSNLSTGQPNIGTGVTFTTGTPGTYSVMVTSPDGCIDKDTVQLFTNPTPALTIWPLAQSVCSGSPVIINLTASVPGSNFIWTVSPSSPLLTGCFSGFGSVISQTLVNSTLTAQTATYHITPSIGSCNGATVDYTVTVNPVPLLTVNPPSQSVCSGSNVSITLSTNVSNSTISWIATGSSGAVTGYFSGTGSFINQVLFNSSFTNESVTYEISASAAGCTATPQIYNVPVVAVPDLFIDPPTATICSGNPTSITLSSSSPLTTFSWLPSLTSGNITGFTPGSGNGISQVLTNHEFSPGSVMYDITASNGTCFSQAVACLVNVNPSPSLLNAGITSEICQGSFTGFALQANVPGSVFSWTAAGSSPDVTGYASGTGDAIIQQLFNSGFSNSTVTYVVTPNALGCNGAPGTYTMIVHPAPDVAFLPTSTTVCSGVGMNILLISQTQPVDFSWSVSGNSASLTNYYPGSGQNIQQTPLNSGPEPGTVTYVVTPESYGCPGNSVPYTVIVNPNPGLIVSPHPSSVCSEDAFTLNFSSPTAGTNFSWTASAGSSVVSGYSNGSGSNLSQILENTGTASETVTYVIIPAANQCQGYSGIVTVAVKPKPDIQFVPAFQSVCWGQQATIAISSSFPGAVCSWTAAGSSPQVSGYAGGSGNIISQALYTSGFATQTVTYTISSNLAGCISSVAQAQVLAYPVPDITIIPAEQTLCSGEQTSISLQSQLAGTSFQWSATGSPSVTGFTPGTGNSIHQLLTNSANAAGWALYAITPLISTCTGMTTPLTVHVNPKPAVTLSLCTDFITTTGAKPFRLRGGLPRGGLYAGSGVETMTGMFNPAVAGTGTITVFYSYSNFYGCSDTMEGNIVVVQAPPFNCGGFLVDVRDGRHYHTVLLPNGKCWMQENLDFGTVISETSPQTDNCIAEKYNHLSSLVPPPSYYQWDELMDYEQLPGAKGHCPPGWHIPTTAEWEDLCTILDGPGQAGGPLKDPWLLNGFHSGQKGFLYQNDSWAFTSGIYAGSLYWTSSGAGNGRATARGLNNFLNSVSWYDALSNNAFQARCVED